LSDVALIRTPFRNKKHSANEEQAVASVGPPHQQQPHHQQELQPLCYWLELLAAGPAMPRVNDMV
jgi:hypothetical protein